MSLALDTNVLVRVLTGDDEAQATTANHLIRTCAARGDPPLITLGVLLETEWVLRSRYKLPAVDIRAAFAFMLGTQELIVQEPSLMEYALWLWGDQPGSDFADCLHIACASASGRVLATFDVRAAELPGAVPVGNIVAE